MVKRRFADMLVYLWASILSVTVLRTFAAPAVLRCEVFDAKTEKLVPLSNADCEAVTSHLRAMCACQTAGCHTIDSSLATNQGISVNIYTAFIARPENKEKNIRVYKQMTRKSAQEQRGQPFVCGLALVRLNVSTSSLRQNICCIQFAIACSAL